MNVLVTLEFSLDETELPELAERAAQLTSMGREEWDEYRSDSPFGRLPHEYDLVEIILACLWANDDLNFLNLEDTETLTCP